MLFNAVINAVTVCDAVTVSKVRHSWLVAGVFSALFAIPSADAAVGITPPVQRLSVDDGDDFYLYVADQETYDSNIYRVSSSYNVNQIASNASRADFVNLATLGGEGQWSTGRQIIDLDLRADENRFARNDVLNNTSFDGKLVWNWIAGSHLSGQAGAEYNRALAAFAETLYVGRDLVDATTYFGNVNYQLGPHWAVVGDINQSTYTHNAVAAQYNDFRAKSGGAGVVYATNVDDSIELQYRYLNGMFPQDYVFDNALLDRNYREDTTRAIFKYAFTDKTSVDAYAGYLKRDFEGAAIGHYSGDIWRITLNWRPTDKTELVVASWHELHAYLVNESDYFVSRGGSLSPVWTASDKLTLSLLLSLEKQDYVAASTSAITFGSRNDTVTAEQLNVFYAIRNNLTLNFFVRNEHRNSTDHGFEYGDSLANLCIAYKFL